MEATWGKPAGSCAPLVTCRAAMLTDVWVCKAATDAGNQASSTTGRSPVSCRTAGPREMLG